MHRHSPVGTLQMGAAQQNGCRGNKKGKGVRGLSGRMEEGARCFAKIKKVEVARFFFTSGIPVKTKKAWMGNTNNVQQKKSEGGGKSNDDQARRDMNFV